MDYTGQQLKHSLSESSQTLLVFGSLILNPASIFFYEVKFGSVARLAVFGRILAFGFFLKFRNLLKLFYFI